MVEVKGPMLEHLSNGPKIRKGIVYKEEKRDMRNVEIKWGREECGEWSWF